MSYTFTLSGNESALFANISPPLTLENEEEYVLALLNFETYHTIFNINEICYKFYYGNKVFDIPFGAYEIKDISDYVQKRLKQDGIVLVMKANNNTSKVELCCDEDINFVKEANIGPLLGFDKRVLPKNTCSVSDKSVNVLAVTSICIECNITTGSQKNDQKGHILHQFFPQVPPGYKIVETPTNIIYLPINVKSVSNLALRVTDQDGQLINFRGETITIRLHLKKQNGNQVR